MVSYPSGPAVGNFEGGLVASLFNSVRVSVVSGGVLCVIGCLLCAMALPGFRNFDARRYPVPPDPGGSTVKRGKGRPPSKDLSGWPPSPRGSRGGAPTLPPGP